MSIKKNWKKKYQKYLFSQEKESRIAWNIPLERLFFTESNTSNFLNKWGNKTKQLKIRLEELEKKERNKWEDEEMADLKKKTSPKKNDWKGKIGEIFSKWGLIKDKSNLSELSKLLSQEELRNREQLIKIIQLTGRAVAVSSAFLSYYNHSDWATWTTLFCIYAEVLTSRYQESIEKEKKRNDELVSDSKGLLDNYFELIITIDEATRFTYLGNGEIDKALKNLNDKIYKFLGEEIDKNGDGKIDYFELQNARLKRNILVEDLKKNWENLPSNELGKLSNEYLNEIVKAVQKVEEKIIIYRQGSDDSDSGGGGGGKLSRDNESKGNRGHTSINVEQKTNTSKSFAQIEILATNMN